MKAAGLLGLVVVWACAIAAISAQENIRLHFELYKNGKQVATPAVTVKDSETGSVELKTWAMRTFPSRRHEPTEKQSESRL
jgi:hypothetical protein